MCIAIYKPSEMAFPPKKTLKICFNNNPDGAGFMYSDGDGVNIYKGFTTFSSFWRTLQKARDCVGNAPAFVLHFRISTQAGTRPDCTHPFPLSPKMDDLRKLCTRAKIGVAHNGIISLTSNSYIKTITYSDTMQFITDYLTLIINDANYYKDKNKLLLIERLIGASRLAILDGRGRCELIGDGWREDGGCYYSNTSYLPSRPLTPFNWREYDFGGFGADECESEFDAYAEFYDERDDVYYFDAFDCPATECGTLEYCKKCISYNDCYGELERV